MSQATAGVDPQSERRLVGENRDHCKRDGERNARAGEEREEVDRQHDNGSGDHLEDRDEPRLESEQAIRPNGRAASAKSTRKRR
jgi:hypothetical protein